MSGLVPVQHLSWNCMTIQVQVKGVIQLSSELEINKRQTKAQFMKVSKEALTPSPSHA